MNNANKAVHHHVGQHVNAAAQSLSDSDAAKPLHDLAAQTNTAADNAAKSADSIAQDAQDTADAVASIDTEEVIDTAIIDTGRHA